MTSIIQANMLTSNSDRLQKPRHRASVACKACRERRTRCVVLTGENECTQCRSSSSECIINFDDERRKPSSRAYINSLNERIVALERALKDKEVNSTETIQDTSHSTVPFSRTVHPETDARPTESIDQNQAIVTDSDTTDGCSPPGNMSLPGNESMVSKLLSTRGHLSFDQLSGRLRYFGPTTNCHVHSDIPTHNEHMHRQALEQRQRTQRLINTLTMDTHDYLIGLFWQHYNSVIHIVHQAAFEDDRGNGGQFYSGFLHVCILAMAYRFADKTRPEIMRLSIGNKESTLHTEAKFMLDYEIEQPGGITSIAALLLLGDLECGVGRDNVGWLYAGMANRLCFEIGLHLDRSNSGLSEREIEIGRMTLLACAIYDKYWALFLGRPTNIKVYDLETYNLSHLFERLSHWASTGPAVCLETQIYTSLLDLMEIAGKIIEIMDQTSRMNDNFNNTNHDVSVRIANLNRELEIWFSRLTKPLQWTPENIKSAPSSFFNLHQQYHVTMILLHRPFARYQDLQPVTDISEGDYAPQSNNYLSSMSRSICTQHAVHVARVFWQYRKRFNTRQIFVTGLQHAGTAAISLIAALASLKDPASRDANMHYLECLAAAIQDMSDTYQPGESMSAVIQVVIKELRATLPQPKSKNVVPARRDNSVGEEAERLVPRKRHQSFRDSPPYLSSRNDSTSSRLPTPGDNQFEQPLWDRDHPDTRLSKTTSLDGFVVVTPRTRPDTTEGVWPSPITDTSALNYRMFMDHNRSKTPHAPPPIRSAWMGAVTPDVSFPPNRLDMLPPSVTRSNDMLQDELTVNSELDFIALLGDDRGDFSTLMANSDDLSLPSALTIGPRPMFTPRLTEGKDQPLPSYDQPKNVHPPRMGTVVEDLWGEVRAPNRLR